VLTAYLLVAFVPQDAPATLTPNDLFDVPKLAQRLTAEGDEFPARFGRRVAAAMPDGGVVVHDLAEPLPQQLDTLTAGLNHVLDWPDLCGAEEVRELPLPTEALELAKVPRPELAPAQLRRLNRLTLEAAYPDHVKKLYGLAWRPVMAVYGAVGLVVAGLFWLGFRDRPALHPRCNPEEVALIDAGRPAQVPAKPPSLPLAALLRSRSMWLVSLNQVSANIGWLFLVTWLPRYLAEVHKVPVLERGRMAGVPLAVGMAGMLAGGWLTDRLTRALGLRWGRCLPMALPRFLAMGAFVACLLFETPWSVVLALAGVAVLTDLGTPAIWAYNQDVGGRYVASVLGWNNMWGNFGAALSPWLLTKVIDGWGWNAMFLTCAATYLCSGLVSLGVDARVPIAPKDDPVAA